MRGYLECDCISYLCTLHPENAIKELRFSYPSHQQGYHNQLNIERERTLQIEMEKGLAALLLLCCAGVLVTGTPAEFGPEEPNTALESLAQLLEEAAGNNDGFPD